MLLAGLILLLLQSGATQMAGAQRGNEPASNETGSIESSSKDDSEKSASSAIPSPRGPSSLSKPYGYYLKPILERIQANPDQSAKITAILESYRGRIDPLKTEYMHKNQEFLTNLSHGDDSAAIMNQQIQLGRIYSDITLYYCQMSLEVRRVLSPDQIVRYEEFKRQQGWTSSTSTSASSKTK